MYSYNYFHLYITSMQGKIYIDFHKTLDSILILLSV